MAELNFVYNKDTNGYEIESYDKALEMCRKFIADTALFDVKVVDEETKKQVWASRTAISAKKKAIEDFKKNAYNLTFASFEKEAKALIAELDDAYKKLTANLNEYANSLVEKGEKVAKPKKHTLTIKSYNSEVLDKIKKYADSLVAKEKEKATKKNKQVEFELEIALD
jgi:hypothetical protein